MTPAEAYRVLVDGVDSLDFSSKFIPCHLLLSGDQPFPLLVNSMGHVLAAASWYGKGRVVVLTHESYLCNPNFERLMQNAVHWLQPSPDAVVGVQTCLANLQQFLATAGIAAQLSGSFSDTFGVYCMTAYDDRQAKEIISFLKRGGGLLIGGHAWYWGYTHGAGKAIPHFPGNQVVSVSGIHFLAREGERGVFPITPEVPAVKLVIEHSVDPAPDLKQLLDGLTHLHFNTGAIMSELLLHGHLTFPVGINNLQQCFMAAGRYGKGRLVVITHEGMLGQPNLKKLFCNVVHWLNADRQGVIGIDKSVSALQANLTQEGVACEISTKYNSTSDSQAEQIHEFVAEGGGLLIAGHAWWWDYQNAGKHAIAEFPGNKVINRFGISILPSSAYGEYIPTPPEPEQDAQRYQFRRAIFQFQQHIRKQEELKAPLISWVSRLRQDCAFVMQVPVQLCPFVAPFQRVFLRLLHKGGLPKPCQERPVKNESKEALLLGLACAIDGSNPDCSCFDPKLMEGLPVLPSAPPLTVEVNATNAGPTAWVSTALYISPGRTATIQLPSVALGKGLMLQIGCHSDDLSNAGQFCRAPKVLRRYNVKEEKISVSSLWGGLLYLVVPTGCQVGKIPLSAEGAVQAPFFRRGETSQSAWLYTIRHYPAPWAELAAENIILTLPADSIRSLEDPDALLALWDQMMGAVAELAAIPPHCPRPERIVTDVQISAGLMHSGYPIMVHLPSAKHLTDAKQIQKVGLWGSIHELGHNQQKWYWEISPNTTEATCNLWSVYVHEKVLGIPRDKAHPCLRAELREERIKQFLKNGSQLKDWSVWTCLETYLQLQEGFGWETLIQVFSDYQTMTNIKNENPFKMNLWAETFSLKVKMNLAPFFKTWSYPLTDEVCKKLSTLPEWKENPMKRFLSQA